MIFYFKLNIFSTSLNHFLKCKFLIRPKTLNLIDKEILTMNLQHPLKKYTKRAEIL